MQLVYLSLCYGGLLLQNHCYIGHPMNPTTPTGLRLLGGPPKCLKPVGVVDARNYMWGTQCDRGRSALETEPRIF